MLNNEETEEIRSNGGWLNYREALDEAKSMISTVVLTVVFTVSKIDTFVIQVQGLEQMVTLVKHVDKLKAQKKIKNYIINNLNAYPPIDLPTCMKHIRSKM